MGVSNMAKRKYHDERFRDAFIDYGTEIEDQFEKNTEESPAEVEANGPETKNGTVVNSLFVKIREEPNLDAKVLDVIQSGKKVDIISKERGFYKIETDEDVIGYIASNFIEEE